MNVRVNNGSRLVRIAGLVDQLASAMAPERLPRAEADAARAQIDDMVALLSLRKDAEARTLASALRRLSNRLAQVDGRRRARQSDARRNRRLLRALRRVALIVAAGAAVSAPLAAAAHASGSVHFIAMAFASVGDVITHPVTGAPVTVTAVVPNGVIVTGDLFILTTTTVGAVLPDPDDPSLTVEIASVTTNGGTGLIESVTFTDTRTLNVVTPLSTAPGAPPGGPVPIPGGAGDVNPFQDVRRSHGGGGGRDGALFVPATSGGNGQPGLNFGVTVGSGYGNITTVTPGLPGLIVASIGGDGGNGGDGYLGASGASGGNGGAGGNVSLTSYVPEISTTGAQAHGIVAQSRSGIGGQGGSGFVFSSGGSGGAGNDGGNATTTNHGAITTYGTAAHGVFAQSLGGGAGSGGGSYGLFGNGGAGNTGGSGSTATAVNYGSVTTFGANSYGVSAQSIGGIGGDAGAAVGLVSFTSDGAAGGNGGAAIVRAESGSEVETRGSGAYGLFAQSIGGGGGNGGLNLGLVSVGAGGGTGGNGGAARIFAHDGSFVTTLGQSAHGLFAQSIGGGGGNGGVGGGIVAFGSRGASGGTGGAVTVDSGATISTGGVDARGLFAQSVGGGGGSVLGSGGLVALGGSGGGAGGAGAVSVTTSGASSITTTGAGADGIFAQSVGGGGGSGSSTGGVVALGGGGGAGGNGGAVTVSNGGSISTTGHFARGVFAQSVGGGGGSGGDSGGLATIGGKGSAASTGGDVTVTNAGAISTAGNLASAIQVQSIGGGGGDGGSTGGVFLTIGGDGGGGGASGVVTVNNAHNLTTTGDDSHGVFAQSVGGGGGSGGSTVSISAFAGLAIGGAGASGGDGGLVDVNFSDRTVMVGGSPQLVAPVIHTTGDRSRGVYAQSVGGGGGNGGFAAQVSAGYGIGASIAIGGSGGVGGLGGQVSLDGDAVIITEGDYSQGVFAQSVGGGGGNGGFATAFAFAAGETAAAAFSVGVGGSGGTGGAGGLVTIDSGGAIETHGDFSTGFLTQSVGGGGGNGGFSVSFSGSGAGVASAAAAVGVGGSGGSGGSGGTVNALFDGTILTSGDDSGAALIQSVGGGGGNGGFNIAGAVSASGTVGVAAAVGVGGAAGDGGAGGTVTGRVGGAVQTGGERSTGVTIQSVGGGGGSGGFNIAGSIGGGGTVGGAASIGVGGAGGGGGAGGDVTGSAGSTILTTGDQSGGLLVQSVGGGGGGGGFNVAGSIGGAGTVGAALSVGVGGSGGGGGGGGVVIGHAEGVVQTTGDQSTGVTVQSIGGGGGSGAFNVSGSIGGAGTVGAGLSVGVGGAGGGGGDGGAVTASAVGITTSGDQSGGFLAQSVGGGGGNGGFDVTGSIGGGGSVGAGVSVGIGGSGGGGGIGGAVGATVTGDVTTLGDDADAIVAQSVGGGGGNGGFSIAGSIAASGGASGAVSVGVGGSGGLGGRSGDVVLDVLGAARTAGLNSDAIVAQSIGGGGGNGGFAVVGNIAGAAGGAGTVGVGVGGFGGGGGNAGGATLRVNSGVADAANALLAAHTTGDGARAVLAQSVGGGGGNGAFAVTGGISGAKGVAGNVGVGVGGGGGGGGDGGVVVADVNGDILTAGDDAAGILAQSLGGGGGNGGFSVAGGISGSKGAAGNLMIGVGGFGGGGGDGGAVSGVVTSDITTLGDRSTAVTYQSVGGGGGAGGFTVSGGIAGSAGGSGSVSLGVGGGGGDGGAGGAVDLDITGVIQTAGDSSDGVLAQSVGGGGGNGAFAVTGNVAFSAAGAGTLGVGIGGMGGGGGDGGAVTLKLNDGVLDPALVAALTTGDGSRAVVAQSIGGGGGNGGFSVTAGLSLAKGAAGNLGVGVGGGGGDGGDAGAVSGEITGDVRTGGDDASAVLVQSVGGGGGNGGFNITGGITGAKAASGNLMVGVGGFGGLGGDAGTVSGGVTGDILTLGDRSFGATYQSLGGGGGNGGFNVTGGISVSIASGGAGNLGVGVGGFGGDGGDAGAVDAYITGDIDTLGRESYGALLQSVGGGGGNGGFNITGGLSASTGGSGTLGLGLGGFGGGGGNAGAVTGVLTGDVTTAGDDAYGALLQSLGGAGGNGGLNVTGAASFAINNNVAASIGIGIGGFAGGGGNAGDVDATVVGQYATSGVNADAVIAQSLGGGGGNGGLNVTGALSLGTGTAGTGSIGIGGFGGAGGDAGAVSLVRTGDTETNGLNSDGVMAQSVGGGGGNGAINVSGALSGSSGGTAGSLGFGLGGFGGGGGDAGDVTAVVTGNVHARGAGPVTVVAAVSQTTSLPAAIVGIVDQIVPGAFETIERPAYQSIADGSHGVVAQSIGGGGGSGGLNVTGQISLGVPGGSSHAARSVSIGVGGFGGSGGDAGNVDLTVQAPGADRVQVSAIGDDRSAVIAQSVGGGGGVGGINVSGGLAMDGVLTAGVGGFGGAGGVGRDVRADVDADLFATGARSRGMMVQSIGGGGGSGAINIAGGVSGDPAGQEPSLTFGLGGFGGAGNISGDVDARHNGQIMVQGFESIGLLAQSVAGGGGSGGLNVSADVHLGRASSRTHGVAIGVGIGGSGGDGADAGDVTVDSVGDIFINAQPRAGALPGEDAWESVEYAGDSVGLLAQSIGGGGGVGGINVTGVVAPFGQPAAIGVGGSGGSGGNGGAVDVLRGYEMVGGVETTASGLIRTFGDNSDALVAQSIGGGGGRAGMNFTFALTAKTPSNNALAALITVGGGGAGAGSGDDVSVRHFGNLVTEGVNSAGLVAQSVGGGGGDANFNVGFGVLRNATALNLAVGGAVGAGGEGGDVSVDHEGVIVTKGRASNGVRAQSIGGGGGNTSLDMAVGILATNSLSMTIGRQGGTGGASGNVDVKVDGIIDTTGDDSTAVFAQSIGGGGGASSAIVVGASGTRSPNTADAASYGGSISVGIDGGVGATSGDVSVIAAGDITTRGDDARGIHAQSIGGGGGKGGTAGNVIFRAAGAATVSVGGAGGVGATSGVVEVENDSQIVTLGDRSDGILAQSIGGGGGLAGSARTIAIQVGGVPSGTTTRTASVNVGGTGGTGAVGNLVDVVNRGVIATQGELSYGIRAQSIGGGGGVGGAAINFRAQGTRSNDSIDVNVGGSGGTGGAGGAVNVLNEGLIYTQGRAAAGISANSIGGGGGDAGVILDVVAGGTGADQQSHRVVMNFGGSGGTGGAGGAVTVTNHSTGPAESGQIVTTGAEAHGIFAQSLGGGGGNGSSIISITGLRSGSDSFVAGLTVGGAGGSGDTGGAVTVSNDGLIDTSGAGAHGILAQSIGGGGGNGGLAITAAGLIGAASSTPLITVGGTGGDGGDSALVTVNNAGRIVTRGAGAHGIVAQSIGGGGGNAQMGFSVGGEAATLGLSTTLAALVGGLGGGVGGAGGEVVVNHSGDITVLGDGSMAIKAESINGGGGTLTLDLSGITGLPGIPFVDIHGNTVTADPLVAARAGAEGATDMNAGSVTVNTTGTFGVLGENGVGSFNQAIGGGGGSLIIKTVLADPGSGPAAPLGVEAALGGIDGQDNNGGDIDSLHAGDIITTGQNTPGALYQSIGGGGGRAVIDITVPQGALLGPIDVALGGVNGLNESGGLISLNHSGSLLTTAHFAPGAILQSIGGGGGSLSILLKDGSPAPVSVSTAAVNASPQAVPAAVTVGFGANGGAGLDGGAIDAVFSGGFATLGDSGIGLILQSIGAGGGDARLSGVDDPDITLGGFNGAAGDGGAITLSNTGEVFTSGARAHGVVLQSIGGGGGAVFGDFTTPSVSLNADNVGDGGAIAFSQTGDITVLGAGAYGVIAQSLGGGGGWVDGVFAGTAGGAGSGGAIDLDLNGQVFAAGDDGVAVFAQSLGDSGGGNISLISDGLIRGGAGAGAGVVLDGGDQNVIRTTGSISAVSGLAIQAGDGDDTVESDGLVIGNVDLGDGDNAFLNGVDGTFIAFDTIDLRDQPAARGEFVNEGLFLMGLGAPAFPLDLAAGDTFGDLDGAGDPAANLMYGARVINTVELDGDFVQTGDGHLEFDVAFGPYDSDRVNVTGDATVDGTGDITLTWLENSEAVTLFATGGVGADNGLEISDTLALDYSISADAQGVHLGFVSDFGQDFLNQNGQALGGSIDSALLVGGASGIGRLAALLGNMRAGDEDMYSAVFTELDPSPHMEPLQLQFANANSFSNELFGCTNVVVQSGDQCVWASLERTRRESVADFENFGTATSGVRLRAGFEQPARGPWSVAVSIGYDDIEHMRVDQLRAFTDGKSLNLGVGMRRTDARGLEAGFSLSGGWQWVDTERHMNIFEQQTGISSPESRYAQLSGHLAHVARRGSFFARPALNASVTALHGDAFSETGLDGNGVERVADTQYLATLNPELQFGVILDETPGAQGVFSLTVGGVLQSEDAIESPFRLLGASAAADPGVIRTPLDREALRVGADFSVVGDNGVSMRLRYSGEFGDRTDSHSAGLDLRFRF